MSVSYAPEHADAKGEIADAGASVTFTRQIPGTLDEATGLYSGSSTSTVTGSAVRVRGNPKTLAALSLKESEAPTLLFAPTTFGSLPLPGDTVSWNSVTYTVRDVDPVEPNGTAIIARIVVAR
jgi:hypothetical protein